MFPKPRQDLVPNTVEFERLPLVKVTGFREYDARWRFPEEINLVGLEVVDATGAVLGRVEGFFDTGETGVMVVSGTRERMIPFIADYVKSVDREARRITVDWKADYDA